MTRLTIELPDDVADRISAAAAERGLEAGALAAQTLVATFTSRRRLSFAGIGRSNTGRTAAEADEMLRGDFGS